MHSLLKPKIELALLYIILFYHFITNIVWILLSSAPLPWDQAGHTRLAIEFANYFKSLGFLKILDYFTISTYYPPLIHTLVGVLTIFFGHPVQIGAIVVTIFFLISIVLVYVYTYELLKDARIAVLSAVIYSLSPIIFEHSRWLLLEIPLLTFVLASLISLERTKNFSDKKYTRYFFIFLALSLLTKWLAIVYLSLPLLLKLKKISFNQNFFRYFSIFLLVIIPWYLLNASTFLPQVFPNLQPESSDPRQIFTFQNFVFYIYLFINFQLTLYLASLFIVGTILLLKNKVNNGLFILGFILFIFFVFTLVPNKDWRYTLPVVPFASMVIGFLLVRLIIRFRNAGKVFTAFVILFLVIYHLVLSYRPLGFHYQKAINLPLVGWIDYVNINDNLAHAYNNSLWPQEKILKNLSEKKQTWLLCLVDQERFNPGNLLLERDLLGKYLVEVESPPNSIFKSQQEARDYLNKYKFVLLARKQIVNPATRNAENFIMLKNIIDNQGSGFIKINSYPLPNSDVIDLYLNPSL